MMLMEVERLRELLAPGLEQPRPGMYLLEVLCQDKVEDAREDELLVEDRVDLPADDAGAARMVLDLHFVSRVRLAREKASVATRSWPESPAELALALRALQLQP